MARANPASEFKFTFLDYRNRQATLTLNANYNLGALTMNTAITDIATLRSALSGISGGTITRQEFAPYITKYNGTAIDNPNIQRERQWVIVYQDNVNFEMMSMTVPCARVSDPTNATIVDTEGFAILTMPQWTGFKQAFENVARSKDGNNVTVKYAFIQDTNL
jgi:hypothetical protein